MYWYCFVIQFKMGESAFTDEVLKSGVNESDALGAAWANVLQRYPRAVYLGHAVE